MQLYVGCSGWSYSSWEGPFYPEHLDSSAWLHHYSKVFDYVEINSSFYNIPSPFTVRKWFRVTPENFRFVAKFPKVITHEKKMVNVDKELDQFFEAIAPLYEKTLTLLIQLPPSIMIKEGLEKLRNLIPHLDKRFRYSVEVRHKSWFQDLAYNFFANEGMCLVWSQLADIQTPPIVTTDFLYMRFIGDRSIDEKDFGKIQKDRIAELHYWANELKKVKRDEAMNLRLAIASANNHYAGFGPATANMFRTMMGIPEVNWEGKRQPTLFDF